MNDYIMIDRKNPKHYRTRFCDEYMRGRMMAEMANQGDSESIEFIPTKNAIDLFDYLYDNEEHSLTNHSDRGDLLTVATSIAEHLVAEARESCRYVIVKSYINNLHIRVVHQFTLSVHTFSLAYTAIVQMTDLFRPICCSYELIIDNDRAVVQIDTINKLPAKLSRYQFTDIERSL